MSSPADQRPRRRSGPVITRTEVTWRGERLFDAGPAGRTHRIDAAREGSARSGRDAAQRARDVFRRRRHRHHREAKDAGRAA